MLDFLSDPKPGEELLEIYTDCRSDSTDALFHHGY